MTLRVWRWQKELAENFFISVCSPLVFLMASAVAGHIEEACQTLQLHAETNLTSALIVAVKWDHVETPYLVVLWILVAAMAKISGM